MAELSASGADGAYSEDGAASPVGSTGADGSAGPAQSTWSAAQTRAQWSAVARLRWRIFRNNLFRKGQRGEGVARLFLYALLAGVFLLPALGAGAGAYFLAQNDQLPRLSWLLWGVFLLAQFANINLGQPGTTFDPTQLIRFPLPLRHFVLLRLFFGLLSPANILVVLMGGAITLGLGAALTGLWPFVAVALLVFVTVNVLFSRMVFAWVDRWLSTRRAREVFTGLLFLGSLGVQYVNVSFNTGLHPRYAQKTEGPNTRLPNTGLPNTRLPNTGLPNTRLPNTRRPSTTPPRWKAAVHIYDRLRPALNLLPPELTAHSVESIQRGQPAVFTAETAACAAYGVIFLSVFALRMRNEFRGESLSDQASGGSASAPHRVRGSTHAPATAPAGIAPQRWFSGPMRAVLTKEILYTRRNMGIFYALIAPLAMVFLFAGRMATRNSTPWVLPSALAYTLVGVMTLSYNSFGLEAAGSQFYFLAPVRLRDVLLAKNLMGFGLAALEVLSTVLVTIVVLGRPSLGLLLPCLLWAAATLLTSTALGNRRSLAAPRQIKLSKAAGKQVSPLSALMSLGILLLSSATGACVLIIGRSFHLAWVPFLAFSIFFAAALGLYVGSLRGLDRYALNHREQLFQELCKA